jgi:hypothetical protein
MRDDLGALRVALDHIPAPPFDGAALAARRVRVERRAQRRTFALAACAALGLPSLVAAGLLLFNGLEASRTTAEVRPTPIATPNDALNFAGFGQQRRPRNVHIIQIPPR